MSLKLRADDEALRASFHSLKTLADVAYMLEIKPATLGYYLHRRNNYRTFALNKRSGGHRAIATPSTPLKIIQQKLNQALHAVYGGRSPAHGCVPGKSIITNASSHLGKKLILNLDLQDFFPSIHFGRVKGMFRGKPYRLPEKAALTLAQICCFEGRLPAGAPTSPTVANMVCAKLDSDLKALARGTGCKYTRYVDDITFSTGESRFPSPVAYRDSITNRWMVGDSVCKVLTDNGFQINAAKTRVLPRGYRQEVTGLLVSDTLNVKRKLIRQVKAMLHAWEHWGLEGASQHFHTKYDSKQRRVKRPDFARVVRGKIEFIGSVRGRDDFIYLDMISKYCKLDQTARLPRIIAGPRATDRVIEQAIWLIEELDGERQGTGFAADDRGILTANHVVETPSEVQQPWIAPHKYPAEVTHNHAHYDVAALHIRAPLSVRLKVGNSPGLKVGDYVKILGLPHYQYGSHVNVTNAQITQEKVISGVTHYAVFPPIIRGGSGGPVLNSKNEVVGIAVKGQDEYGRFTSKDEVSCFVPINVISEMKEVG